MSLETHRGEPVSNGKCTVSDTVKRVQNETGCESPMWESAGSDSASKPIPRRSSLIKVGHNSRSEQNSSHKRKDFKIKNACKLLLQ